MRSMGVRRWWKKEGRRKLLLAFSMVDFERCIW